jgi:hypothetical protein
MVSVAAGLLPLRIELFRSNEFYPARVLLSLHKMHLCRDALNFAHASVVDDRHVPIVPGGRDRIPSHFGDNAAISGITRQKTRVPIFRSLDSVTVIVAARVSCSLR